jgi:hypothetical protein
MSIRLNLHHENKSVEVTLETAKQSQLIKGLFEEFPPEPGMEVPIPEMNDVSVDLFERTIAFMERRSRIPMKEIQKPLFITLQECVDLEDYQTVSDLDFHSLGKLLKLSTYLNVPDLVDLIGARLADMIRDLTPEQLAEKLGVNYRDVISEEEENQVRKNVEESLAQYN